MTAVQRSCSRFHFGVTGTQLATGIGSGQLNAAINLPDPGDAFPDDITSHHCYKRNTPALLAAKPATARIGDNDTSLDFCREQ